MQEAEQINLSRVLEVDEQASRQEKTLQDEFKVETVSINIFASQSLKSMKRMLSKKLSVAEDTARGDRENHELVMQELKR